MSKLLPVEEQDAGASPVKSAKGFMRKLGTLDHDECAPWCDHDPANHHEDCTDGYCDGIQCYRKQFKVDLKVDGLWSNVTYRDHEGYLVTKYGSADRMIQLAAWVLECTLTRNIYRVNTYEFSNPVLTVDDLRKLDKHLAEVSIKPDEDGCFDIRELCSLGAVVPK